VRPSPGIPCALHLEGDVHSSDASRRGNVKVRPEVVIAHADPQFPLLPLVLRRLRGGAMGVLVDGVDDLWPHRQGNRVTHALDHHQLRAGN